MEARMHDDPFGAQPWGNLDVGLEVMLDGVGDIGPTSATLTAEAV